MNNKLANMIRDYGVSRVFDGIDFSELIQIDTSKYVFPIDIEEETYFCEINFIAKKEDYSPDYDVKKFAEKVKKAEIREKEKEIKKEKAKKKKEKTEVND